MIRRARETLAWGMLLWAASAPVAAAPRVPPAPGSAPAPSATPPAPVSAPAPSATPPAPGSAPAPSAPAPSAPEPERDFGALSAADRAAFEILGQLASGDDAVVVRGLVAASGSGRLLFDGPSRRLLAQGSPAVRAAASSVLARLEWPADTNVLYARIQALDTRTRDADGAVRLAAIEALGAFPLPPAAEALGGVAAREDEGEARAGATALEALGRPDTLKRLSAWLARGRAQATAGPPPLLEAARTIVESPVGATATGALGVLAWVTPAALARPFVYLVLREGGVGERAVAADQLARERREPDVAALAALLTDPSPTLRLHAARALRGVVDPRTVALIAERLLSEERTFVARFEPGEERVDAAALLRELAGALRDVPTPLLAATIVPRLEAGSGYGRKLGLFLIRERRGPDSLWPRAQTLFIDRGAEAGAALLEEPLPDRQTALLPHVGDPDLSEEARRILVGLVAPVDDAPAPRLLGQLGVASSPDFVAAVAAAVAPASDAVVVPPLAGLLRDAARPATRLACYVALVDRATPVALAAVGKALEVEPAVPVAREAFGLVQGRRDPAIRAAVKARLNARENPEVARAAVIAAGELADAELLPELATLARSPVPDLAQTAYQGVRAVDPGAALATVRALASDQGVHPTVRALALADLGRHGDVADRPLLEAVLRRGDATERLAARKALHAIAPDVYPEWDNVGRIPLVVSSAGFGAALLTMVSRVGQRDMLILDIGGGAIGGATALLLTLDRDVSLGQAGYFTSMGAWGGLGGYALGRTLQVHGDGPLWSAIGGELLGLGVGALTIEAAGFDSESILLANAVAASVGVAALSGSYLGGSHTRAVDAFMLGAAGAMVPLAAVGHGLHLRDVDPAAMAVSLGFGVWLGAWAPRALTDEPRSNDYLAGIGVGQALGLVGGMALSGRRPFTAATGAWMGGGGLLGAAVGGGAGLAFPSLQGRSTYQLLEAGTLVGAAAGAWLGPQLELRGTDIPLALMLAAAGAFSGSGTVERTIEDAGLSGVDKPRTKRQRWGGPLLGGSLGLIAGLGVSQYVDLSVGELAMSVGSAGVLGAAFGGLALLAPSLDDRDWFSRLFAAGAAAGGLGVALLAPRLRYDSPDFALAASLAGIGAFAGSLTPAYWRRDTGAPRGESFGGSLVGLGVGVLGAAAISQTQDLDAGGVLHLDLTALAGMGFGAGLGLVSPALDRRDTVALLQGGTAVGVLVGAVVDRRSYSSTDRLRLALAGAVGAGAGTIIPSLWRRSAPPSEERWGGALIGATTAMGLGRLSLAWQDHDGADVAETALFAGLAASAGAGAWSMPLGDRLRAQLLFGATLAGWAAGELASAHTRYNGPDAGLVLTLLAEGAAGGLGMPLLSGAPDTGVRRASGAALVGGAFGLGGLALSQAVDPTWGELREAWWTSLLGASLAYGAATSGGAGTMGRLEAATAGLWGGLGLGLVAGPHTTYDGGDLGLAWTLASLGAAAGLGLPDWSGHRSDASSRTAGALAGAGALGLGGLALAQVTSYSAGDLFETWLVSSLGSAAGYGVVAASDRRASSRDLGAASAGLAAGLGIGLLAAPHTRYHDGDAPLVGSLMLLGGAAGMGLPDWTGRTSTTRSRVGGGAVGAGALGLGGLALAQVTSYDGDDLFEAWFTSGLGSAAAWGLARAFAEGTEPRDRGAATAGLAAGAGLGLLSAPHTSFSDGDMGWIVAGGALGSWLGLRMPDAARADAPGDRARAHGAGGGAAAGMLLMGAAAQAFEAPPWWGEGLLSSTGFVLAAEGLGLLDAPGTRRSRALSSQVAALGGFGLGTLIAPHTDVRREDSATITTLAALGVWHGLFLPEVLGRDGESSGSDRSRAGGALAGGGTGLLLGFGVSQVWHPRPAVAAGLALASGIGSMAGYGLGELLVWERRRSLSGLELGGALALGIGAVAAPRMHLEADDASLLAAGSLWGSWHGAWLGELLAGRDGGANRQRGGAMLGGAVGLGAGAVVAQFLHRSSADVAEATVGLAAGGLIGVGAGDVLHLPRATTLALLEAGGLIGLTWGLAVAPGTSYADADPALVALTTAIGTSHGLMLRGLFESEGREIDGRALRGGAAFGAGAGLAAGLLLAPRLHLERLDVLEVALATAAGDAVGFGLAEWLRLQGRAYYGALELGALGMTAIAIGAAPHTSYGGADGVLVMSGALFGGALGAAAPTLWGGNARSRGAGVLLGTGVMGVATAAAAQKLRLDVGDVGEVTMGTVLASGVGGGLGLVLSTDDRVATGLLEATTLAGFATLAAVAPSTEYRREDVLLGGLAGIYGVYQGAGVSLLASATDRQVGGAMVAAGAAGALVGTYLGRYLHLDGTELLMLLAGSAWGVWLGVWSAPLIDDAIGSQRSVVALGVGTTAIATDLAIVATSLAVSELVEMPPRRFAWVNVAGGFGVVIGTAAAALSNAGARGFQLGCVAGSVGGLAVGTLVTGFFDFTPRRPTARQVERQTLAGVWPDVELLMPSVQMMPADASGRQSDGVLFTVTGVYR